MTPKVFIFIHSKSGKCKIDTIESQQYIYIYEMGGGWFVNFYIEIKRKKKEKKVIIVLIII